MRVPMLLALAIISAHALHAQTKYPTPPRSLGDSIEIALARTAAPAEISDAADIYVLRGTDFVKAKSGTNGCACMVSRDSHGDSRYPICFDREGAKTWLFREIMESSLRAKGKSEAELEKLVAKAYDTGELKRPSKAAVAYMMSPKQVLFSSADSSGVRVGAWSPHLMLLLPNVEPDQLGLATDTKVTVIQIHRHAIGQSELIVKLPAWADGTPVTSK